MAPASKEELEAERQCWEHRRDVEELDAKVLVALARIQSCDSQIKEIARQRAEEKARAETQEASKKSSTQTRMWIAASIALPIALKIAEFVVENLK